MNVYDERYSVIKGKINTAHVLPKQENTVDALLDSVRFTFIEKCNPREIGPVALTHRPFNSQMRTLLHRFSLV